ncbi:hypothetical protein HPP92_025854 [Vanilla planifolia]|uniref:Uncharacterized protein n=1 Tax=Vanilla planifolia TaxID=51239 RepID=A0A835U9R1_VANPL|nr:hypothetical protein HPP92_025854 [Vanilla planifolia]
MATLVILETLTERIVSIAIERKMRKEKVGHFLRLDNNVSGKEIGKEIGSGEKEIGGRSKSSVCGKALNCLDIGGEGSALIAAGGSDPVLRVWDPRKPGNLAPIFQFSSHSSWISACKWHKRSIYHLLSASYDGKVMLWDLRTAWPLAKIDSHNDKVLCADWWKEDGIISGGADSKLFISSGISIP